MPQSTSIIRRAAFASLSFFIFLDSTCAGFSDPCQDGLCADVPSSPSHCGSVEECVRCYLTSSEACFSGEALKFAKKVIKYAAAHNESSSKIQNWQKKAVVKYKARDNAYCYGLMLGLNSLEAPYYLHDIGTSVELSERGTDELVRSDLESSFNGSTTTITYKTMLKPTKNGTTRVPSLTKVTIQSKSAIFKNAVHKRVKVLVRRVWGPTSNKGFKITGISPKKSKSRAYTVKIKLDIKFLDKFKAEIL